MAGEGIADPIPSPRSMDPTATSQAAGALEERRAAGGGLEEAGAPALEELASDPSSRKRFLRMAGGGAVAALAGLIAACGDDEEAGNAYGGAGVGGDQFGQGDVGIAGYALFLERLEVAFYEGAIESGRLGGRALELVKGFAADEAAHVKTLAGTFREVGGPKHPEANFQFEYETELTVLDTAVQIETLGAGAYLGQARRIQNKQLLAAALSIHSVEARHAAALAQMLGRPISPDGAFAAPASSSDVLRQIRPYIAQ
jgi:rubrerythrin